MGASKERLQEIFDHHASYQRPIPVSIGPITRESFKEHLSNPDAYTSFLELFNIEIKKNGMVDTVRRWVWSGDLLARTVGGALHPLIHIGYGLEFEIPGIVAEGLAMMACTESFYLPIVGMQPELNTSAVFPVSAQSAAENATSSARGYITQLATQLTSQLSMLDGSNKPKDDKTRSAASEQAEPSVDTSGVPFLKDNPLIAAAVGIKNDKTFDGLVSFDTKDKSQVVMKSQAAADKIKSYVGQWEIEESTKGVQKAFRQLHAFALVAYAAAAFKTNTPGSEFKLDFFLMHALTSSEFVHQYISKVSPSEAASLMRSHLSVCIVYYITSGRPGLNVDALLGYNSPNRNNSSSNHWLDVFNRALKAEEVHVIKAVRSCAVGQILYGPSEGEELNSMWLKAAEMTLDKDGSFIHSGLGFEETWN